MRYAALLLTLIAWFAAAGCRQNEATKSSSTSSAAGGESAPAVTATPVPETPPATSGLTEGQERTMPGGLRVVDLKVGNGAIAETGANVSVHYTGWLEDGSKFDSSLDRGTPFTFRLGGGQVIRGWDEGVKGMRVGGKRRLTIPPAMAYGERGYPGAIPPNATLTFEVELLNTQ